MTGSSPKQNIFYLIRTPPRHSPKVKGRCSLSFSVFKARFPVLSSYPILSTLTPLKAEIRRFTPIVIYLIEISAHCLRLLLLLFLCKHYPRIYPYPFHWYMSQQRPVLILCRSYPQSSSSGSVLPARELPDTQNRS